MLNRELATRVTVPIPGVIYSFDTDGRVLADEQYHPYFSRDIHPKEGDIPADAPIDCMPPKVDVIIASALRELFSASNQ
jgi:hypothetical protein